MEQNIISIRTFSIHKVICRTYEGDKDVELQILLS